jgi:Ca2+/Na+ antiporter
METMRVRIDGWLGRLIVEHPALGATLAVLLFLLGTAAVACVMLWMNRFGFWAGPIFLAACVLGSIWVAIYKAAHIVRKHEP